MSLKIEKQFIAHSNSLGFTLIEMIVAISVFSIGIVAVLYMFPVGAKVVRFSQMQTVAIFLAQEKIEEVISSSYNDIEMLTGTIEEGYGSIPGFESYKRVKEIAFFDPETSTSTDDINSGMKKIEVTVFWGEGNKNTKVATLISQR